MNRWRPHRNRACVIAVVDRADGCMAGVSGFGPPTVLDLERFLEPSRFRGNAMCVDNRQAYWSFSIRHRVPRIVLSTPKARRGRYHMVNVNQFLTHFEQWMTRFNGVATRYLANYVAWFVAYREAFAWLADAIGVSQQWLARSFDLPQFGS